MPHAIDQEAFSKRHTFDVSQPDGTPTGLPVKQIPHMEYPRVVYKHPTEPFKKIEHRNRAYEIVGIETIPAEHLSMIVNNEKELAKALKDGWMKEPYKAPPLPDPNANLYG